MSKKKEKEDKGKKWDTTSFMECWKKHGSKATFPEFADAMIEEARKLGLWEPTELAVWNRTRTIRKKLAKGAVKAGHYATVKEATDALDKLLPTPKREPKPAEPKGITVKDIAGDLIPGFYK